MKVETLIVNNVEIAVGTTVRIKHDLCSDDDYPGSPGYIRDLERYRNMLVTVKAIHTTRLGYTLEFKEIPCLWSPRWIEVFPEINVTFEEIEALIKDN